MLKKDENTRLGKIKLITTMIIWGTVGIFGKEIKLSSLEITFYRSAIGAIVIVLLGIIWKWEVNIEQIKPKLKILIPSGISLGFAWFFLFQGYKYTTIARATLVFYIAPVFMVVFSSIFLKEKLTARRIICIIVAIVGLLLVQGSGNTDSIGFNHSLGTLYSLLAAVLYAGIVILNKFCDDVPSSVITAVQLLTVSIIFFPIIIFNYGINIVHTDKVSLILIISVGVIHTALAFLLYTSSVQVLEGQTIAVLSYIDPVVAVILSATLLKERLDWLQIFGGLLILGSAYISENKKKPDDETFLKDHL